MAHFQVRVLKWARLSQRELALRQVGGALVQRHHGHLVGWYGEEKQSIVGGAATVQVTAAVAGSDRAPSKPWCNGEAMSAVEPDHVTGSEAMRVVAILIDGNPVHLFAMT